MDDNSAALIELLANMIDFLIYESGWEDYQKEKIEEAFNSALDYQNKHPHSSKEDAKTILRILRNQEVFK